MNVWRFMPLLLVLLLMLRLWRVAALLLVLVLLLRGRGWFWLRRHAERAEELLD